MKSPEILPSGVYIYFIYLASKFFACGGIADMGAIKSISVYLRQ
jgi:hypothetical protein